MQSENLYNMFYFILAFFGEEVNEFRVHFFVSRPRML